MFYSAAASINALTCFQVTLVLWSQHQHTQFGDWRERYLSRKPTYLLKVLTQTPAFHSQSCYTGGAECLHIKVFYNCLHILTVKSKW